MPTMSVLHSFRRGKHAWSFRRPRLRIQATSLRRFLKPPAQASFGLVLPLRFTQPASLLTAVGFCSVAIQAREKALCPMHAPALAGSLYPTIAATFCTTSQAATCWETVTRYVFVHRPRSSSLKLLTRKLRRGWMELPRSIFVLRTGQRSRRLEAPTQISWSFSTAGNLASRSWSRSPGKWRTALYGRTYLGRLKPNRHNPLASID